MTNDEIDVARHSFVIRHSCFVIGTSLLVFIVACAGTVLVLLGPELFRPSHVDLAFQIPSPLELAALPTANRFDFPLGSENGALSYNAQRFTENKHLGDDLNGIGGENSDLGDPIYCVADGRVLLARDGGTGWGNVIIVLHAYIDEQTDPAKLDGLKPSSFTRRYIQSYYAHCDSVLVKPGDEVRRGQQIATVGTGGGRYFAHLHFEMREFITPFVGPGYRQDTRGWIDPTAFINAHRGAPEEDVGRGL
jgi:hypothetical protein